VAAAGAIYALEGQMRQKRFADWFEKMSAAFMVGAVLTDKSAFVAVCFGLFCLYLSVKLTERR
jgi:hypothetical protein